MRKSMPEWRYRYGSSDSREGIILARPAAMAKSHCVGATAECSKCAGQYSPIDRVRLEKWMKRAP